MEITNEIKAKAFAQYWSQKVAHTYDNKKELEVISCTNLAIIDYLILKPLSAISDEDAIECGRIAKLKGEITIERFSIGLTLTDENGRTLTIYYQHTSNVRVFDENKQAEVIEYSYPIYQKCVLMGYDVPHILLGGKTLMEAGLAIYE